MPQDAFCELRSECDEVFPVPHNGPEQFWLQQALALIIDRIRWLRVYFEDPALEASLQNLKEKAEAGVPPQERDSEPIRMGGDFALSDAMIGTGNSEQPNGILILRGLLWIAIRRRRRDGKGYKSRAEDLASALRSVAYSPEDLAAKVLGPVLTSLDGATSLGEAIRALDDLSKKKEEHRTLFEAWTKWLRPTLVEIDGTPRIGPEPRPPRHVSDEDGGESAAGIEFQQLRSRKRLPDQLPSEPPDEADDSVLLALYGSGTLSRRQAEYRARQAIWGGNYLLLPSHTEALFPDVFGAVLNALVRRLEDLAPTDAACAGWVGCLLKAVTGRNTTAVMAVHVGATSEESPRLYLDLDAGTLSFPPYWKQPVARRQPDTESSGEVDLTPSYFQPTPVQREWLSPVHGYVTLPLVTPVRKVLAKHQRALRQIPTVGVTEFESQMRAAAAEVGRSVGVPITVANLRRSLGPLVMEACGDLAMAQLICSDSFGRPSAQQHYYAPHRRDVAAIYAEVLGQYFEESTTPRLAQAAARLGSELLVEPAPAKRLAEASFRWGLDRFEDETGNARLILDHRRFLDHLVRMILATTGHRWASSIFDLTLGDFDPGIGAALFSDKRHDVAHDPRLVGLPKVVCTQLASYLRHISQLADVLPGLRNELFKVLRGDTPVLFDLREAGQASCEVFAPTLESISARGPAEWRVLPENWGRTYLRTRAIEMGAPPFLVACQLGHYDAVGYPCSNQSPTEPVDVILRLQPWLDRVAKTQDWAVMDAETAFSADGSRSMDDVCIWPRVPLKDWHGVLRKDDRRAQKAHTRWETALRRDARKVRESAVAAVLAHPVIVQARIAATYLDEPEAPDIGPLAGLDLYRIRTELLVDCGDDPAKALARVRALRLVLRVVAKRARQPIPTVTIPIAVRRPLDNAFFTGACMAFSQVHLLRVHVGERSKTKRPGRGFVMQVARTAEVLALFGGVDDVETLIHVLAARGLARSSAKIPDLMLVPLARGRVLAFRGVAALALANLARQFSEDSLPWIANIEVALAGLLPSWVIDGGAPGLLARLCSTVAVANRFEYSPAARFALDPAKGSMSATIDEQLAFIDGDPIGPKRADTPGGIQAPAASKVAPRPEGNGDTVTQQYNVLVKMIPVVGKNFTCPSTGKTIAASAIRSQATRDAVIADLGKWLAASDSGRGECLWPVVRMLGEWTRLELGRLKADGTPLKYRSVKTYLTRIGRALVGELGNLDPTRWTERVVEDAYEYALEASDDAKHKVAAALLSFHRCIEALFDLPDVDLSSVYAHLKQSERNIDTQMILPVERSTAFAAIARRAWSDDAHDPVAVRIAREADAITPFLGYAGARLSEPMGMQVGDIGLRPSGMLWARVRSNRLRSLKTRAATRVLVIEPASDPQHLGRTWQWTQAVRRNAGPIRPEGVYILSAVDKRNDLAEQREVARVIREELARATGRPSERLHRLRHLSATERIVAIVLSAQDAAWIGLQESTVRERGLQPRDLHAVSVPMGHAHWMTTIQWYLHLPWVLQSRAAARLREGYFDRRTVAGALGVTPYTLDNLLRGAANNDRVRIWFDHVRAGRTAPLAEAGNGEIVTTVGQWKWTAEDVGRLVAHAWRTKDLLAAMMLLGIPLAEADRIETCAARMERKLGLRLIPEYVGDRRRDCPGRAVRRLASDSDLEKIWHLLDKGTDEQQRALHGIVAEFFEYLEPRSGEKVLLTREGADALARLLEGMGMDAEDVIRTDVPGKLDELTLRRHGGINRAERYRGLALKRALAIAGLATKLHFASSDGTPKFRSGWESLISTKRTSSVCTSSSSTLSPG